MKPIFRIPAWTKTLAAALLVLSVNAYAGRTNVKKIVKKSELTTSFTSSLTDPLSAEDAGYSGYLHREVAVRLYYDNNLLSNHQGQKQWEYTIQFTIQNGSGGSYQNTLVISNQAGNKITEALAYPDLNWSVVNLTIQSVSARYYNGTSWTTISNPSTSTDIPQDIYLETRIETERYPDLSGSVDALHISGNQLYWSALRGAEEYDLEWVFIDYSKLSTTDQSAANTNPFTFKEPVRITTSQTTYALSLAYPDGRLYVRVRPVGRKLENSILCNTYGDWTNLSYNSLAYITTTTLDGATKTWSYVATYAEDGKSKSLVNYFDATLRNRQSLTNLSSDNTTLVSSQKYDNEGRAALQLLPYPVSGKILSYQSGTAMTGTQEFNKSIFDASGWTAQPLSETSGAAQYYGPENTLTSDPYRTYIPDANGYVYSLTEYMPDNSGRIKRQSGIGEAFKPGSHNVSYIYGEASKQDIDRLFGTNVLGSNIHCQKKVEVDPNGQATVSYYNKYNKLIASGLLGTASDKYMDMTVNKSISVQFNSNITVNNEKLTSYSESLVPISIPSGTNTVAYFTYTTSFVTPPDPQLVYKYDVRIYDPQGVEIVTHNGPFQQEICTLMVSGNYKVTKMISVDPASIKTVVDAAVVNMLIGNPPVNPAITTLDELKQKYIDDALALHQSDKTNCESDVYTVEQVSAMAVQNAAKGCDAMMELLQKDATPPAEGGTGYYFPNNQMATDFYNTILICPTCINLSDSIVDSIYHNTYARWKPEWGLELAKLHREYCKVQACRDKASLSGYFYELSTVDTWDDAISSGYINPMMQTIAVKGCLDGGLVHNITPVAATQDSNAFQLSTTYGNYGSPPNTLAYRIADKLINYDGTTTIWDHVYNMFYSIGSTDPTRYDYNIYRTGTQAEKNAGMMEYFNKLYFAVVSDLVDKHYGCSYYGDGMDHFKYNGKEKIDSYEEYVSIRSEELSGNYKCADACSNNIEMWLDQIEDECGASWNSTYRAEVKTLLMQSCTTNCADNNPIGFFSLPTDDPSRNYILSRMPSCTLDCSCSNIALFRARMTMSRFVGTCETMNWGATGYEDFVTILQNKYMDILHCSGTMDRLHDLTAADFAACVTAYNSTHDPDITCTYVPVQIKEYTTRTDYIEGNNVAPWLVDVLSITDYWLRQYRPLPWDGYYVNNAFWPSTPISRNDLSSYPDLQTKMNYTEYLVPQDYGVILNNATLLTATQTPVRFMFYYCDDTKEISLVNDKVAGISSWEYDPNYRPNTFGEYTHVKVKFLMHVYVNGNWDVELKDVYLYKIGTSFPEPYFVPNGQTVQKTVITGIDVPSNQMKYYMGMGIQFHPDSMMNRLRSECRSRIDNSAIAEGIEKYQKRLDSAYVVATTSVIGQALDPSNFADNLSCTYDIQDIAYTLYYYDQAGNLIQTVPPQGFDQNPTNGVTQHHLKTQYKYNSLNQLVWQRTPDGGTTEYFYDKAGQLRFSQNSKQRACSTYSYTRYDNLGRVVETGKCNNLAYVLPFIDELTTDSYGRMVSQYPESGMSEVTRIFYDNAPAFKPAGITTPSNTRSRIVASAFYNSYTTDGAYDHAAWYSYDAHGNVKTLWQDFHLQAPGIKQINYEYDLVSGKVNKVLYQPGSADQFIHRYEYDADNRITRVYTSRDGRIWEQDAKYYYYLHGPLARVELGHDKVQGLDYAYTLQGWIKGVNSNTLLPSRDIGKDGNTGTNINKYISRDAFGFSLGYYSGDYATTGSVAQSDLFLADNSSLHALTYGNLYNGNISNMLTSYTDLSGVVQPQAYKYAYDQLNRIRSMAAYQVSSASNSVGSTSGYASSYTYDLNGNLLTQTNNSTSAQFDNLQYKYDRLYTEGPMNYNRLTEVNDQSANSIGGIDMPGGVTGFTYDSIGNIVSETATNYSTNISWTNSNKVKTVSGSRSGYNFTLGFAYDASGERITKHTYNQQTGSDVTTYYVRDATGNILATYTLESATLKLESYCMYGSSRLGELKLNKAVSQMSLGALTGRTPGSKRYELTNHLGNVVATLSDDRKGTDNNSDGKADYYEPILVSASDFYPFGMQMPGRIISSENYRYGFNGKEKDDELNGAGADYDFGARIYDARLGRFLSTDWYSAIFPSETPFSFGGNNPVYFIDYNGDYRVSQAFKDAYPVITKYLETNAFDDITNSPTIIRSMIKNTDLGKGGITLQQITDMATWGHLESPTLDGYSTDNPRGEYDPTNNVIKISSNFLKSIEEVLSSTTSTEEDKLAALYLFYYILIHESTHYAEWKANPDLEQIRDAGINTGHCGERVEEECFGEYNVPIKWNDKGYPIEYAERFPIDDFPTFKAGIRRATRIINFKKENKKRDDVIPTPVGKKRRRYEPSNPY